jgi:L-aminopeptidase/D-esterase-like protein
MIQPGARNLITDVDGVLVGNADDEALRSGVTVILPEAPATAAVDVRGGAPGTREIDSLDPTCLVDGVDAVCLSGGSAFGLDSATGVMAWLKAQGRGFAVGPARIPIVPGAILFDLLNGGDKEWGEETPYRALGLEACEAAGREFRLGNAGAGLGAKAGRFKGGLGSVSAVAEDGVQVGALMAVNCFGSVTVPGSPSFWAWTLEQGGELGGQPAPRPGPGLDLDYAFEALLGASTTIGVVATNVSLDKAQALRVAIMAQDGIARAVRPVHTPFDGDTVFVLSTAQHPLAEPVPASLGRLGLMAADCVARATARGVYAAEPLGDLPGYRQLHGDQLLGTG